MTPSATTTGTAAEAPPVRRDPAIEDPSNLWVVHPISNRLVPLCARVVRGAATES